MSSLERVPAQRSLSARAPWFLALISINVAAGGNRGTTRGSETRWQNTRVSADKNLTLRSGHDTRLIGAVASGERILAIVEGDLSIESLQAISKYVSRDRSFGVQVSLCIPPICYGASSASANYAQVQRWESEYGPPSPGPHPRPLRMIAYDDMCQDN